MTISWFQPNAIAVTDLSITCIDLIFLMYLLRLRNKSKDCHLIIWIYSTAFLMQLSSFFVDVWYDPPAFLFIALITLESFHFLSVIWCSYRFHDNSFPRESLVVTPLFAVSFVWINYLWFSDYFYFHKITLMHALDRPILCGSITLLATVNYLRKLNISSSQSKNSSFFKELIKPSSKENSLYIGFAVSLFIYTLIELMASLSISNSIGFTFVSIVIYLLSVSITVLVAVAYLNYASEKNSFVTKLVGVTLFLTLTVISVTPLFLFGTENNASTISYIKVFLWIVPITTLLIAVFLPLLLRLTILKHLNQVLHGVQAVISGDLNANINIVVNDEIGDLSQHFNYMTESIRQRTEQLNNMRESIATDFHDQTGNMLSAITRQAGLLKVKFSANHDIQPIIESIVKNSNSLYASSKDFLWQMNHSSDEPHELFDYLTGHGQLYYNQFDIAFSGEANDCQPMKIEPSVVLNVIFIFKEAMTNVVKHAGATEVRLSMSRFDGSIVYALEDDGCWKEQDSEMEHYGLTNMQRRCQKNGLTFNLTKSANGTRISIGIPVSQLLDRL